MKPINNNTTFFKQLDIYCSWNFFSKLTNLKVCIFVSVTFVGFIKFCNKGLMYLT